MQQPLSELHRQALLKGGWIDRALANTHTAALHLLDTIRPSAPLITRALHTYLGLSVTMLTGDSASEAVRVSAQLSNVPVLSSRALPHEKGDFIATIQASPTCHDVAMVGDGLNDAPALAAADVGILLAPAGASALSSHARGGGVADVVLTTAELGRLVEAVVIARRTVRWNRAWATAYGSSTSVVGWSLLIRRQLGDVDWRAIVQTNKGY